MSGSSRRRLVIGHANTWHDPAIAIGEGDRIFAEGIERHTQCKRALDMPRLWYSWRAVREYLSQAGAWPVVDADVVSISSWSANASPQLLVKPSGNPIAALLAGSVLLEPLFNNQLRWCLNGDPPRVFAPPATPRLGVSGPETVSWQPKTLVHQLAHAATAVYTSPFDDCIVMVADGYGEGTALSFFHFADNQFELLHEEQPSVSLGLLYAAVTQFCGFNPYEGEEWKVMGLAAFGEFRDDVYGFFKERLAVDGLSLKFRPAAGSTVAFDAGTWAGLEKMVGGFRSPADPDVMRAADLAHNFQRSFVECIIELAANAGRLGLSKNLALAGGCALNSTANGKLVAHTDFDRLHVPCAPGDDGNALGVVLHEMHQVRGEPRSPGVMLPYLGSTIDDEEVERILGFDGIRYRKADSDVGLCSEVAELLASGKIVAWVQGRAEFGPRALGNRSILADPRDPEMKDRINHRVKFREFYRPLAPAILDEFGTEYFHDYQASPYMERTLVFREEVRDKVPSVVHVNGTGRVQTVREDWNPLFYGLIRCFHQETGVPILLNTSFNVMGKPIVHTAQDAIAVFYTTGLDHLVLGRYILSK